MNEGNQNSLAPASISQRVKHAFVSIYTNLTIAEVSGSLGDLGTLLPLLVALSSQRSIKLAPALFFGGLANLITGFCWDVPMCVQPMKSISAVALSEGWTSGSVTAAGIITGGAVFLLGITNIIELVNKIVPGNVVSGLQIGVGVRLASKGINMVSSLGWFDGYDSILLGVICALLCLFWLSESYQKEEKRQRGETSCSDSETIDSQIVNVTERRSNCFHQVISCFLKPFKLSPNQKHPVGIYLFLIGATFASITLGTSNNDDLPLQLFGAPVAYWAVGEVTAEDYWIGFAQGAIPQLPLTALNSVISVCALAHNLYPKKRKQDCSSNANDAVISRKDVAISVGLMNLVFCPFGSMPNCHGAGGLAGQHRLGARHGASIVFLGVCKMTLAIFFGKSALALLDAFPTSVLGVMLTIAGQELATTGFTLLVKLVETSTDKQNIANTDEEEEGNNSQRLADLTKMKSHLLRQNTVIAVVTAIVIISTGKTHIGAGSGWIAHMVYGGGIIDIVSWYKARRSREIYMI